MAASRKKKSEEKPVTKGVATLVVEDEEITTAKPKATVDVVEEAPIKKTEKKTVKEVSVIKPKADIGEVVYVSKGADTDLEGFKLFPEYKTYTYTVEAYDANTDTYSLRRLNLLLHLKGEDIVRPEERAHDKLNRIQF